MGILMSLLRIVLGVVVGIGIMIGICLGGAFLATHFPGPTAFTFFCLIGVLLVWKIAYSLRSGKMAIGHRYGGRSVYELKSIEFWFYVLFFGFLSLVSFIAGFYFFFHPPK